MTELLLTFPPPTVQSIVMIPRISDSTAGRFRIWLNYDDHSTNKLLWDRKVEGKFPEAKEIVSCILNMRIIIVMLYGIRNKELEITLHLICH